MLQRKQGNDPEDIPSLIHTWEPQRTGVDAHHSPKNWWIAGGWYMKRHHGAARSVWSYFPRAEHAPSRRHSFSKLPFPSTAMLQATGTVIAVNII